MYIFSAEWQYDSSRKPTNDKKNNNATAVGSYLGVLGSLRSSVPGS